MAKGSITINFAHDLDTSFINATIDRMSKDLIMKRIDVLFSNPKLLDEDYRHKAGYCVRYDRLEDPYFGLLYTEIEKQIDAILSTDKIKKTVEQKINSILSDVLDRVVEKAATHYANRMAFENINDRIEANKA